MKTGRRESFPSNKCRSSKICYHKNGYYTHMDISNRELCNEIEIERTVNRFCEELAAAQGMF